MQNVGHRVHKQPHAFHVLQRRDVAGMATVGPAPTFLRFGRVFRVAVVAEIQATGVPRSRDAATADATSTGARPSAGSSAIGIRTCTSPNAVHGTNVGTGTETSILLGRILSRRPRTHGGKGGWVRRRRVTQNLAPAAFALLAVLLCIATVRSSRWWSSNQTGARSHAAGDVAGCGVHWRGQRQAAGRAGRAGGRGRGRGRGRSARARATHSSSRSSRILPIQRRAVSNSGVAVLFPLPCVAHDGVVGSDGSRAHALRPGRQVKASASPTTTSPSAPAPATRTFTCTTARPT